MEITITNTIKRFNWLNQIELEFVDILNEIQRYKTFEELKRNFGYNKYTYFEYGFGGAHMWVKQLGWLNQNNLITVIYE